ncbi:MAG: hypothetical protein MHM6MM_002125 [Cercozoa sp. M6MM]
MSSSKNKALPLAVSAPQYGFSNLMARQIYENYYYTSQCVNMTTFNDVINEILNEVTYVTPFVPNSESNPSTAFCLLYKLMTLRLTRRQLLSLVDSEQNGFLRVMGMLYARMALPASELWDWIGIYAEWDDPELVQVQPLMGIGEEESLTRPKWSIGQIARRLLTEARWLEAQLPRIPVPIQRELKRRLLKIDYDRRQCERMRERDLLRRKVRIGKELQVEYPAVARDREAAVRPARVDKILDNGNIAVTFFDDNHEPSFSDVVTLAQLRLDGGQTSNVDFAAQILREERSEAVAARETARINSITSLALRDKVSHARRSMHSDSGVRRRDEKVVALKDVAVEAEWGKSRRQKRERSRDRGDERRRPRQESAHMQTLRKRYQ